ncbi:hypothetical protein [Aureimonas populi]|uniref:Lipoprotein SmpA/OmlA domain-containing protein n=1 Tax=Aureimonas populi TaxID=1701758 RepID=A0ABW5CG12_9HYPH|nr:hypothetical protein [Aureimonas populi]
MPTIGCRRFAVLASLLLLSGCAGTYAVQRVDAAKTALVGLSERDVRMCAGFPTRQFEEDEVKIWSYELRNQTGGVNFSAPLWVANTNLNLSGGGSCHAQFKFVDGRLTRLAYAGDNDGAQGRDSLCAPIIDGCMSYLAENGASGR